MPTFKLSKLLFIKVAIVILGLLVPSQAAEAQYFEFNNKQKRENISFKFVKNLIIIPLTINGKGPYNFILDTGVGVFLISDPSLTDTLQIKNLRSIKITGFGEGEELSAYVTPSLEVRIGNTTARNMPGALLKKDIFGLSNFVGIPIHGLLGFEFFESFMVRINYLTNVITIFKKDASYILRKGSRIPITIEAQKPYVVSDITLTNGEELAAKLIIDTGAGHPISLETTDGVPFPVPDVNIVANLGIGLSGPIKGHIGRIKNIELGHYKLDNVIAAFPNYDEVAAKLNSINRNGNLGNGILKRFNVVFDYHRNYIYLKPIVRLKEPFEYDMSGMELMTVGPEFKRIIINRIEPFSPADKLGLEIDDEILSINFKPVTEMTMEEIDKGFRSKNGLNFILTILPKGSKTTNQVILTLERRI